MKEIGSIFPLDEKSITQAAATVCHDGMMVSLCREALYLIGRKEAANGRRLMLPDYTCDSVIQPFRELGYEYISYPINKDLTIDTEETLRLFRDYLPNLIIVHPYYGMDLTTPEQQLFQEINNCGCEVIMDLTQCLFSRLRMPYIRYYAGSTRKWFAIPDGAFLEGYHITLPDTENNDIVSLYIKAMTLRDRYFKTGNAGEKHESIQLSHIADAKMEEAITPHRISDISTTLLSREDAEEQQKTRLANYRCLYEGLKDSKEVELIADISRLTTAPLYFPFRVSNIKAMQQKLAEQSIYARLIWQPDDNILTIAIDQRYNTEDMKRVVAAIRS